TCQVPGTDGGAIFGTGDGKDFQEFSKECPAFTAELAALAIRVRANHFGPINKNKIEIVQSCWDLLQEIESAIDELNGCIAVAMYLGPENQPGVADAKCRRWRSGPRRLPCAIVAARTSPTVILHNGKA